MNTVTPYFTCIPLGVKGGLDESNLPSFMLAPIHSKSFICLDAGTILAGLTYANAMGCFEDFPRPNDPNLSMEGHILHNHIKAFLITHSYLDHVQGLVDISPNDSEKQIYGLQEPLDDIRNHLFNWRIWPNLCDGGEGPALGKYRYFTLAPGKQVPIDGTLMRVEAFQLAHGPYTDSTAFLIEVDNHFVLYMGDTGPDEIEKRSTTEDLWKRIAPLVRAEKLHGIFIEASYPDERPDNLLYSHLTPAWIVKAFQKLACLVQEENPQEALEGLNVAIIHIKPDLMSGTPVHETVKKQLLRRNTLGLNLLFPQQGERFSL